MNEQKEINTQKQVKHNNIISQYLYELMNF